MSLRALLSDLDLTLTITLAISAFGFESSSSPKNWLSTMQTGYTLWSGYVMSAQDFEEFVTSIPGANFCWPKEKNVKPMWFTSAFAQ
jgi:hypothetical protein